MPQQVGKTEPLKGILNQNDTIPEVSSVLSLVTKFCCVHC